MLLSIKRLLRSCDKFFQTKGLPLPVSLFNEESFNPREHKKYDRIYEDYWIPAHRAKRFHLFRDIVTQYIYKSYLSPIDIDTVEPRAAFCGVKMLVVGCGGGILSEALSELNFDVTGIDPDPRFILIAKNHIRENILLREKKLNYVQATIEEFSKTNIENFDTVVVSNVLEYDISYWHKENFLRSCLQCCKPGGSLYITTMDSSIRTLIWTMHFDTEPFYNAVNHRWYRGTNPAKLAKILRKYDCKILEKRGISFLPLKSLFVPSKKIETWYFMHATKKIRA